MNPLDQIRTPQGRYPVKLAECEHGELADGLSIRFIFKEPGCGAPECEKKKNGAVGVEELAFLVDASFEADHVMIEKIAKETGPLFGPNKTERLMDWFSESMLASAAIDIQAVVNSDEPDAIRFEPFLNKDRTPITKKKMLPSDGNAFLVYSLAIAIDEKSTMALFGDEEKFPLVKRFAFQDAYDYAFIGVGNDNEGASLAVSLFVFHREITSSDFLAACSEFVSSLKGGEVDEDDALRSSLIEKAHSLGIDVNDAEQRASNLDGEIELYDEPFCKEDVPHLQKMVHAIASLNLDVVGVDLFCSGENDGFLVFPNYISYLWYRFVCRLGQVKIARCEVCGRGFSLLKGRGKPRKYCSEQCKTKAKNARVKSQRDACRKLFIEQQLPVSEIAKTVYAEELSSNVRSNKRKTPEEAENQVRKNLVGYPAFKHKVDDDLRAGAGAPFVRRCMEEGVLSAEQVAQRISELGITPKK